MKIIIESVSDNNISEPKSLNVNLILRTFIQFLNFSVFSWQVKLRILLTNIRKNIQTKYKVRIIDQSRKSRSG